MSLETVIQFFEQDQTRWLNKYQAIGYVLWRLSQTDSYFSEMLNQIAVDFPGVNVSDTILNEALHFLVKRGAITSRIEKAEGRGRPRKMYSLQPDYASANAADVAFVVEKFVNQVER